MSEDTEYGRTDGYFDGHRGSKLNDTNGGEVSKDHEYAVAYRHGYEVGKADAAAGLPL